MSLLLLFAGSSTGVVTLTPIAHGAFASIVMPDEIPAGVETSIYMEVHDSTGPLAQDQAPQLTVYTFLSDGTRSPILATMEMTQVGSSNLWGGVWTPNNAGVYEVKVVGLVSATAYLATASATVRSKFDPIGLAIDDVLVSRMDADQVLGLL